MSEINQNRYDQLLRRVADLKGGGSKVNDALSELFPVIEMENLPSELLLLMGTRLCMGRTELIAGGAGNINHAILRNPIGSGVIATILQIFVWTGTAQDINFGPTENVEVAAGVRAVSDLRKFPEQPTLVTQANNNLLVTGPAFFSLRDNGIDGALWDPPRGMAVLSPGGSFIASSDSSNSPQATNWFWIERPAEPSELNL